MSQSVLCRSCSEPLTHIMCNLGMSPLANSYVKFENAQDMEKTYPLRVWICDKCLLAQLESYEAPSNIFSEYLYFSSYSTSWVEHARNYCEMVTERFRLSQHSKIVEIASNDGYLLQHFKEKGMTVVGVEPAENVAKVAIEEKNIPSIVRFFGKETARYLVDENMSADLLIANNVLAHVPEINDFVSGLKITLNYNGVLTLEFPHLMQLLQNYQYDTIYHEHFSYLSLLAVEKIFRHHELTIFDVEEIPTHGGSLRIFARHSGNKNKIYNTTDRVVKMRTVELEFGLRKTQTYIDFGENIKSKKRRLIKMLIMAKDAGKSVVAYGAAAKGVTLVNYCGIGDDLVDYVVDKSPHKQNHYMPGVRLPIYPPEKILETNPDYVLILPWNLQNEICHELSFIREWGGRLIIPIPEVYVLD